MATSARWAYLRIMAGTILGGVLGFYVMHRVETSYKQLKIDMEEGLKWNRRKAFFQPLVNVLMEKMKERLRKYEMEKRKREILEDPSSPAPRSLPES